MWLFKKKAEKEMEEKIENANDNIVYSPVKGSVKELSKVEDNVFSTGVIGEGIAIMPLENTIVAPINGKVMTVFPTKHVVGIKGNNGCELIIHMGIDTVELNGKYFDVKVKEGQTIEAGTLIGTAQFDEIKKSGYKTDIIVVVTNSEEYGIERIYREELIDKKLALLNIRKKES